MSDKLLNKTGLAYYTGKVKAVTDDLDERITNLSSLGRYLSNWSCVTGLAGTNPPQSPFAYRSGDYFLVSDVAASGGINYKPSGSSYTIGVPSTVVETESVLAGDRYLYDGTVWVLQKVAERVVSFSNVAGDPYDNTNLKNALDAKQASISDLDDIREGAGKGETALQPNDNISELTNDSGFITSSALSGYATETYVNNHHDTTKQDTLVSGTNIKTINNTSLLGTGDISVATAEQGTKADTAVQNLGDLGITSTATELNYTNGVTSNIQTQLNNKQAAISDLATIRSGAALGSTALQSVPAEYVTETELEAYHDSSKQNVTDNSLTTTSKTIVGAINEVNAKPAVASLSGLTDVTISNPIQGQNLTYDATLQKWKNTSGGTVTVSFSNITGQPSENTNLQNALDEKQDVLTAGTGIDITSNTLSIKSGGVGAAQLANGSVTTDKIADGAVQTDKVGDLSITEAKLGTGSVSSNKIQDGAITTGKLATGAVGTGKIQDSAVTKAKLASGVKTSLALADTALQPNDNISELTNNAGYITSAYHDSTKQDALGTAQMNAVNSGITSAKVSTYDGHVSNTTIHVTAGDKSTWNAKQNALVSGTNIKTINNTSVLGSGNISVATTEQGTKADNAASTIATYGDIVTHSVSEFATASQGSKADSAVQNLGDLGVTATASELNVLDGITASTAELNYTDGVTSNIQTQLNSKQATISDLATIRSNAELGASALQPSDVINNTTSTNTDKPLSANMGKSLQDQINNLLGRGKYLSIWDSTTGLAIDNPPVSPYTYHSGDFFIVGKTGTTNYKPSGSSYTIGQASTVVETNPVKVNDAYYYDGTQWSLLSTPISVDVSFSSLAGSPYDNTNLADALNGKQATISDLTTIRNNAGAGKTASDTIATYGNIVTHNTSEFATSAQGSKADTAVQNLSDLGITATATEINYIDGVTSSIQTQINSKQATISDLASIRSGATAGSTAVQPEDLATVATTGSYNDLSNKPTIPTKTSDLTNDSGYITSSYHDSTKQDTLVSGTNIKTLNNQSLLGSGNIEIEASSPTDDVTISENTDGELQAIGVIDKNAGGAKYDWVGTKAQHTAQNIATLHPDWICYITDDTDVSMALLQTIYPVGSLYMTVNEVCPFNQLFGVWQKVGSKLLVDVSGSNNVPVKGSGKCLGMTVNADGSLSGYLAGNDSGSGHGYSITLNQNNNLGNGDGRGAYYGGAGITTDASKSGIIADISNALTTSDLTCNIFQRIS